MSRFFAKCNHKFTKSTIIASSNFSKHLFFAQYSFFNAFYKFIFLFRAGQREVYVQWLAQMRAAASIRPKWSVYTKIRKSGVSCSKLLVITSNCNSSSNNKRNGHPLLSNSQNISTRLTES